MPPDRVSDYVPVSNSFRPIPVSEQAKSLSGTKETGDRGE